MFGLHVHVGSLHTVVPPVLISYPLTNLNSGSDEDDGANVWPQRPLQCKQQGWVSKLNTFFFSFFLLVLYEMSQLALECLVRF